jgi:hypothetical protein
MNQGLQIDLSLLRGFVALALGHGGRPAGRQALAEEEACFEALGREQVAEVIPEQKLTA